MSNAAYGIVDDALLSKGHARDRHRGGHNGDQACTPHSLVSTVRHEDAFLTRTGIAEHCFERILDRPPPDIE